jgi:Lar family restriction alleviation protein
MTTNTQEALKPCPFCGRDDDLLAVETRAGGEGWWRVFCDHCCTDGPSDQVREKAIAAWNHRLESLEALLKELRGHFHDDGRIQIIRRELIERIDEALCGRGNSND